MDSNEFDYCTQQIKEAKKHSCFLHYTSLNSLAHILKGRSLRLSKLENINDPVEVELLMDIHENKVFTMCFSHCETETIPLWKMYAGDNMGLCLIFDSLEFLEDKQNYIKTAEWKGWELRESIILDVLYDNDTEKFERNWYPRGEDFPSETYNLAAGFLKTRVWEFEKETRVRCYIDVSKGNRSIKSVREKTYNYPDFKYVYCHIPDDTLNSFKITFNPFMDSIQKDIVKSTVKNYLLHFNDANFVNSDLEGKIR